MKNIFVPNGTTPSKILYNLARKEFGDKIRKTNKFTVLKQDMVKALKSLNSNEYEENKLDTLVWLEHMNQNDFGNFISIRFAYWAMIISVAVVIIGDTPIYVYFDMSKRAFGTIACFLLTLLLVIFSRVIHVQHDQIKYLKFKLLCFEEINQKKGKCDMENRKLRK